MQKVRMALTVTMTANENHKKCKTKGQKGTKNNTKNKRIY